MKKILFLIILFNCNKINLRKFKNINKYPMEDELISAIHRADNQEIEERLKNLEDNRINIEELRHENKNIFMVIFEQYGKNCHNSEIKFPEDKKLFFLSILDKYREIMEKGFISDKDDRGRNLFFYAINTGIAELITNVKNLEFRHLFEDRNIQNNEAKSWNKLESLYELCKKDSNAKELNEILKDLYNSFEGKNDDEETALSIALKNKAYKIARILIEKFEKLSYVDGNNSSYFYLTIKNGGIEIFNQLLNKGNTLKLEGKLDLKEILDRKNNQGNNVLHLSSKKGYTRIVKDLLKNNVSFNEKNAKGETALHKSVKNNRDEVVQLLLKKEVDINVQDENHNTPLHYAVLNENTKIISLLLNKCADPNIKNRDGLFPKDLTGNSEITDMLEIKNNSLDRIMEQVKNPSTLISEFENFPFATLIKKDDNQNLLETLKIITNNLETKGPKEVSDIKNTLKEQVEIGIKLKKDYQKDASLAIEKVNEYIDLIKDADIQDLEASGIKDPRLLLEDLTNINTILKKIMGS